MKPVLQALVLAERIYEDALSHKKIIAGTFNEVLLQRFETREVEQADGTKQHEIPMVPGGSDMGSPMAYISLTDVINGSKISLQMVNMTKNEVLFNIDVQIQVHDRLATVEIVVPLPPIRMFVNAAGTFSLDVVCLGELLGSHRILVKQAESRKG